jgi:hypothetical protein
MMVPLRWTFPKSYQQLEILAGQAGVHEFRYRARITWDKIDPLATVSISCDGAEWARSILVADLEVGGEETTAFFHQIVDAMATVVQDTYKEWMHHREV